MNYRPEIDGLRAIAVLAVIVNHFDKAWLPSGHLGVDVFFVISGYVIMGSLHANQSDRLTELLSGFYLRRIKRLMPALVACVMVTSVLICLVNPEPSSSLKTGLAAIFGVSNFRLYSEATDYFGGSAQLNAFTHTWSLGVEEQFYLFFPLLVWTLGFTRSSVENLRIVAIALTAIALASLFAFVYFYRHRETADLAFYMMPTRAWQLAVGALVFVASQASILKLLPRSMPLMALASLVILLAWSSSSSWTNIGAVLLTAVVLGTLTPTSIGYGLATYPVILFIGRISYSLYLWHWSVLVIGRWTIGSSPWSVPLQLLMMLALACGSYFFIEKPLRSMDWSRSKLCSFGIGGAVLASASCLLLMLLMPLSGKVYAGSPAKLVAVGVPSLTEPYTLRSGLGTWRGIDCVLSENSQVGKEISIDKCTLGDFKNSSTRIIVIGNSFSTAFVQSFDELVVSGKFAVTITSSWGASPVSNVPNSSQWSLANNDYWKRIVPSLVAPLKAGDWVFLVNDLADFLPKQTSEISRARLELLANGLEDFAEQLSSQGVRLAVLHSLPFARESSCEPQKALPQWFTIFGGPCPYYSRESTLARRVPLTKKLTELADRGALVVVDVFDIFCPGPKCTYMSGDGQLLYRDEWSHPSVEAAKLVAPLFKVHFDPAPEHRQ